MKKTNKNKKLSNTNKDVSEDESETDSELQQSPPKQVKTNKKLISTSQNKPKQSKDNSNNISKDDKIDQELLLNKPESFEGNVLALDILLEKLVKGIESIKKNEMNSYILKQFINEYFLINTITNNTNRKNFNYTNLFISILKFSGCSLTEVSRNKLFQIDEKQFKSENTINMLMDNVEIVNLTLSNSNIKKFYDNVIPELFNQFNLLRDFNSIKKFLQGLLVLAESPYRKLRYFSTVILLNIYVLILDDINNTTKLKKLVDSANIESELQLASQNKHKSKNSIIKSNNDNSLITEKHNLLSEVKTSLEAKWFYLKFFDVCSEIRDLMLDTTTKACYSKDNDNNFIAIFGNNEAKEIFKRVLFDSNKPIKIKYLNLLAEKLESKNEDINRIINELILSCRNILLTFLYEKDASLTKTCLKIFFGLAVYDFLDESFINLILPHIYSDDANIRSITGRIIFNVLYRRFKNNNDNAWNIKNNKNDYNDNDSDDNDIEESINESSDKKRKRNIIKHEKIEKNDIKNNKLTSINQIHNNRVENISPNIQNFVVIMEYMYYFTENETHAVELCFNNLFQLNNSLFTNINYYIQVLNHLVKNLINEEIEDNVIIGGIESEISNKKLKSHNSSNKMNKTKKIITKKKISEVNSDSNSININSDSNINSPHNPFTFECEAEDLFTIITLSLKCLIRKLNFEATIFNSSLPKKLLNQFYILFDLIFNNTSYIVQTLGSEGYINLVNSYIEIFVDIDFSFDFNKENNEKLIHPLLLNNNIVSQLVEITKAVLYLETEEVEVNNKLYSNAVMLINKIKQIHTIYKIKEANNKEITEISNNISRIAIKDKSMNINNINNINDINNPLSSQVSSTSKTCTILALSKEEFDKFIINNILNQTFMNLEEKIFKKKFFTSESKDLDFLVKQISRELKLDTTFSDKDYSYIKDTDEITDKEEDLLTCLQNVSEYSKLIFVLQELLLNNPEFLDSLFDEKTAFYMIRFLFCFFRVLVKYSFKYPSYFIDEYTSTVNTCLSFIQHINVKVLNDITLFVIYNANKNFNNNIASNVPDKIKNFNVIKDFTFLHYMDCFYTVNHFIDNKRIESQVNSALMIFKTSIICHYLSLFTFYCYLENVVTEKQFNNDRKTLDNIVNALSQISINKINDDVIGIISNFLDKDLLSYFYQQTKQENNTSNDNINSNEGNHKEKSNTSIYFNEYKLKTDQIKRVCEEFSRMMLINKDIVINQTDLCSLFFECFGLSDYLPKYIEGKVTMFIETFLNRELSYYEVNNSNNNINSNRNSTSIILYYIANSAIKLHNNKSLSITPFLVEINDLEKRINGENQDNNNNIYDTKFEKNHIKIKLKVLHKDLLEDKKDQINHILQIYFNIIKKLRIKMQNELKEDTFYKDKEFFTGLILNLINLALKPNDNSNKDEVTGGKDANYNNIEISEDINDKEENKDNNKKYEFLDIKLLHIIIVFCKKNIFYSTEDWKILLINVLKFFDSAEKSESLLYSDKQVFDLLKNLILKKAKVAFNNSNKTKSVKKKKALNKKEDKVDESIKDEENNSSEEDNDEIDEDDAGGKHNDVNTNNIKTSKNRNKKNNKVKLKANNNIKKIKNSNNKKKNKRLATQIEEVDENDSDVEEKSNKKFSLRKK